MIQYDRSPFGISTLCRMHGSAVYRATIPGFASVIFIVLIHELWLERPIYQEKDNELGHPYAIGVLVGTITFLLVFRTQQAYARYWEACSSVYQMMSKWMDASSHTAVYHLQCDHYDHIRPPSFYDYPHLNAEFLTRDRETHDPNSTGLMESMRMQKRATTKSIEQIETCRLAPAKPKKKVWERRSSDTKSESSSRGEDTPVPLESDPRLDGNWGALFDDNRATFFDPKFPDSIDKAGFASSQGGNTPPLFLQELAHLTSLLTGVALATLRNDIEGAESPLDIYEAGSPWPEVDPDKMADATFFGAGFTAMKISNFIGIGRTPEERTRYNASRPLAVLGGVSAAEIRFLQMARGPYAKTQLCWSWLSEFITREHLAGSTGNVGPPIISRIIQFLGDGMIYYNHARKITFIPFPFPHAQLSVVYVLVTVPAVAFLMDQYTEKLWVGCILTFLTVTALAGIHEVARELENPFRNVPNELPLVTMQAQFNEALLTMYAGFHPDNFWKEDADRYSKKKKRTTAKKCVQSNGVNSSESCPREAPEGEAPETRTNHEKSLDAKIQELLEKIDQQGSELARLRATVVSGIKDPESQPVEYDRQAEEQSVR
jgi:predicted membrane chloride channel (bestrophin family)